MRRVAVRALAGVVLLACLTALLHASAGRTVKDGVYSLEQAKNGRAAYSTACGSCHQESLAGDTMSPALVGEEFRATWEGKKLRALYSRIISTMPSDNPGTLPERTVIDVVAYLLEANGFPSGPAALERPDELNDIDFVKQQ
jgi:quinoprotein glucose dehydrogenase